MHLVLAALLIQSANPSSAVAPGAAGTQSSYPEVLVVGIDGLSINMLDGLRGHAEIPHLESLRREGMTGDLESLWPLRTPQVWTSVVTGKYPSQHGIWDHLSNNFFNPPEVRTKEKRRVTTKDRKSRALWQLLDEAKIPSLTVGWMASWPADPMEHGAVVAPVELMGDKRQTTIKGSFYRGEMAEAVAPSRWRNTVAGALVDPGDIRHQELVDVFGAIPPKGDPLREIQYVDRYTYGLQWSLARARTVEKVTLELAEQIDPKVVLSYFQCPDSLLHRFWIFHKGPDAIMQRFSTHEIPLTREQAEGLHQAYGEIVRKCYEDTDRRLGRLLHRLRGPNTVVLVVSDHGFGNAEIPHRLKGEPYSGDHLEEAIIMLSGPVVPPSARGKTLEGARIFDITPSLLHYLGLEVGRDMAGKVLAPFRQGDAVKTRATYEAKAQTSIKWKEGWPLRKHPPKSRVGNGPLGYGPPSSGLFRPEGFQAIHKAVEDLE